MATVTLEWLHVLQNMVGEGGANSEMLQLGDMVEQLLTSADQQLPSEGGSGAGLAAVIAAVAEAASAMARLDQALLGHPLQLAFLHRLRLEAVRRQAAVDGQLIDPWHLAALLEGLRLRMDPYLSIIERGAIFDAARHAFGLHQWISLPDFDQEGEIQQAEAYLAEASRKAPPLLSAGQGVHAWIESGGSRPPIRAALIRHWMRHRLLRCPLPLTGAAALRAETEWSLTSWMLAFLRAVADEAAEGLEQLAALERAWLVARAAVAGRRKHSHAIPAVDLLAAVPVLSATALAVRLSISSRGAIMLLNEFCKSGITIEVTHRSKRRLFGLAGMAPLASAVAPPKRPEPGRGRGRPRLVDEEANAPPPPLPPLPPLSPLERRQFDYSNLTNTLAELDATIRRTRQNLDALVKGTSGD